MPLSRAQAPFLILIVLILIGFGFAYFTPTNYELMAHLGMIIGFTILVLATNKKVRYPPVILSGLTAWAFLHLAGSNVIVGGSALYDRVIFPVASSLPIIRYDQIVHAIGFGFATGLIYHIIAPRLPDGARNSAIILLVIALAGLGIGAINEMVEFITIAIFPTADIGGYENTLLDLFGDFVGAILAVIIIPLINSKKIMT